MTTAIDITADLANLDTVRGHLIEFANSLVVVHEPPPPPPPPPPPSGIVLAADWYKHGVDDGRNGRPYAGIGPLPKLRTLIPHDLVLTQTGQVVNDVDVVGNIIAQAPGTMVNNYTAFGAFSHSDTFSLADGLLAGSALDAGAQYSGYSLKRTIVQHSFDGLKLMGGIDLEDVWGREMLVGGSSDPSPATTGAGNSAGGYTHNDGGQASGGTGVRMRRVRFEDCGVNSGLFADPDQGDIADFDIAEFYLQGGNYGLFGCHATTATGAVGPHTVKRFKVRDGILGYPAITAPPWAAPIHWETLAMSSGKVNPLDYDGSIMYEDGAPLNLLDPGTPAAKRWRKHLWSATGILH